MSEDLVFPDPIEELRYALAQADAVAPPKQLLDRVMGVALATRPAGRSVEAGPRISPVDAYRRTTQSMTALLESLDVTDWKRPALRDLDVQGLVGHLIGVESHFQSGFPGSGRAAPEDHIASTQPFADAQATRAPAETLQALRDAIAATLLLVDDAGKDLLGSEMSMHGMTLPVGAMLVVRAFETWTHEEDVRRATGRPLSAPDASTLQLMTNLAVTLLPAGMARAGRPGDGRLGRIVLTGPGGGTWQKPLGAGDAPSPDVRLVADAVAFCRLVANRMQPADVEAIVSGDADLGDAILAGANALALD
jgi:uncharacterized protein (TIGR03083 family)